MIDLIMFDSIWSPHNAQKNDSLIQYMYYLPVYMYLYNFKQLYALISKRSLMKCIGLMGLSITKSISSSQFSHHSFWKKALNKPHGNYPKLKRDSQKRLIFVTHVYFYHDNTHSSYLKSLQKKSSLTLYPLHAIYVSIFWQLENSNRL